MNLSRVVALAGLWCAAVPAPLLAQRPAMKLDQANTATWQNAWTNLLNDVRQSFTPSLPKLVAVEVELVVANPSPSADTLTMKLVDPTGRPIAIVSKSVQTADAERALFVFPEGGVDVSPGQHYSLQLSGGPTFGWKYVVGGYRKGSASFNGQPLLRETRSTFLFRTFGPT
jgi:hypothetical protein